MEALGDRRAFHVQCDTGMERKLDLLVKERTRYRIAIISGIQETQWFESDIWLTVNGRFYILVGLYLDGDVVARREGVGILLDGTATAAWGAAREASQLD